MALLEKYLAFSMGWIFRQALSAERCLKIVDRYKRVLPPEQAMHADRPADYDGVEIGGSRCARYSEFLSLPPSVMAAFARQPAPDNKNQVAITTATRTR
jgi:hypothetical protein